MKAKDMVLVNKIWVLFGKTNKHNFKLIYKIYVDCFKIRMQQFK
jgi:hypothetical protein